MKEDVWMSKPPKDLNKVWMVLTQELNVGPKLTTNSTHKYLHCYKEVICLILGTMLTSFVSNFQTLFASFWVLTSLDLLSFLLKIFFFIILV